MSHVQPTVESAYGARAAEYVETLGRIEQMAEADRDLISRWARGIDGRVVDAGAGPGHWTDLIAGLGVQVEGIDATEELVTSARQRYPQVPFTVARIEEAAVPEASLAGVLAWYSLIHHEPTRLPSAIGRLASWLRPGGSLLIGFFTGPRLEPFDHAVTPAWYWPVPRMVAELETAGLEAMEQHTRTDRGRRPHAAIVARRRSTATGESRRSSVSSWLPPS